MNFNGGRDAPGPLAKVAAAVFGALALAGALMFSLIFFAVLVVLGCVAWGYFWWKTRELRRRLREQAQMPPTGRPSAPSAGGEIIEGEAVRVSDERERSES